MSEILILLCETVLVNIGNICKYHHSSMKILKLTDCLDISQAAELMSTLYIL